MKGVTFRKGEIKFPRLNEICRIATCNNNLPHVTPVSYIFDKGKFYFATDYNTLKYANLNKNNRISLVVDTTENNKNKTVVTRGITTFIHKGRKFQNLYDMFYNKFDWVKNDPWKEGDAPFIEVIPKTKGSWGYKPRVQLGKDLILIYKKIEICIGEICKFIIPIKQEYYKGNGSKIAICTLSSMKLLTEISNDTRLMNNVAIVGRLLSENKGIDKIINYCIANKEIVHLVVCGKDGHGHRAGDSIIALSENGITREGKIIKSKSPYPQLDSSYEDVVTFRDRVTIHNLIEEMDLNPIKSYVDGII